MPAETAETVIVVVAIDAVNDAVRKVEAQSRTQMEKMTAGMGIPPGFKMPF